MRRRCLGFLLAVALLGGEGPAWGQAQAGQRVRLAWVRAATASECFEQPALEAKIVARLGHPAFAPAAATSIEGYAERVGAQWRATIVVRNADRVTRRELTSDAETCAALEAAVTLSVALVIDPDAPLSDPVAPVGQPVSPAAVPPPKLAPTKAANGLAPAEMRSAPSPTPAFFSSLSLRGTVASGLLPSTAAGADLAFSLSPSDWLTPTANALFLPEKMASDHRFAFGLTALGLGACVESPRRKWLRARICPGLWAGSLHSVVYALLPTQPGQRFWAAVSLAPALRLNLVPQGFLELGGELVVPLVRETFTVLGFTDPVFQERALSVRGFAGIGLDFP